MVVYVANHSARSFICTILCDPVKHNTEGGENTGTKQLEPWTTFGLALHEMDKTLADCDIEILSCSSTTNK